MFEVMSSTIKKLNDEYVEYKYFVDLLMLHTGAGYKETATLLLNQNFNQSINIYSIDNAFRIKKLEDKKFLEDMLEDLISDNFLDGYGESSNINRLPQKAIEEYYIECLLKKSDLLEISYIKELGMSLSGEEYQKNIAELYGDRNHELRIYRNEERRESCYCFKAIRTQNNLNLDEIACMMSSECYCHIHDIAGHADYSCCSEEFWSCRNFLQEEYESGSLKSDIEDELFSNKYIQRYLYKNGFTIEGHNQGLAIPAIIPPSLNKLPYLSLGDAQKELFTNEVFTPIEIIYLITGASPSTGDGTKFVDCWVMVNDAIDSGDLLGLDSNQHIPAQQVKEWLVSLNYIYEGFNDNITIDQTAKIKQLREHLKVAHETINKLNLDKQSRQAAGKADVSMQYENAPADTSTLQAILDETHEHHAPDLKHSIQLWIDLYINGAIKSDSHSNKAGQWLSKNTKYAENAKKSTDRIKEISTPFKYWSPHRKKEV